MTAISQRRCASSGRNIGKIRLDYAGSRKVFTPLAGPSGLFEVYTGQRSAALTTAGSDPRHADPQTYSLATPKAPHEVRKPALAKVNSIRDEAAYGEPIYFTSAPFYGNSDRSCQVSRCCHLPAYCTADSTHQTHKSKLDYVRNLKVIVQVSAAHCLLSQASTR